MSPSLDIEAVFSNTVPGGNNVSHAPTLGGFWIVCLSTLQEERGKALSATTAQSWGCGQGSPWPAAAELTRTLPSQQQLFVFQGSCGAQHREHTAFCACQMESFTRLKIYEIQVPLFYLYCLEGQPHCTHSPSRPRTHYRV